MTTEAPQEGRNLGIQDQQNPYESKYRIPTSSIERILNGENFEYLDSEKGVTKRATFEDFYKSGTDYDLKYAFAQALIEDGRYRNPSSLVRHFIPTGQPVEAPIKTLKDHLTVMMMKKGDELSTHSQEARDAEEEVIRFIDRDEQLKQLRGTLPIHVMGAITNVLMFEDVTDDKKKEELRSWTTRALLRPYLRDILVQRGQGDLDFKDLVLLVPDKVFTSADRVASNLIKDYFVGQAMRMFMDGTDEGFSALTQAIAQESGVKKQFLERINDEFKQIEDLKIPDVFNNQVEGWFEDTSPFPLFRQKYFVHEFINRRKILLNGDTGATKTACAYLGMETLGRQKVTVFGPARARNTWPKEAQKIFRDEAQPDVFTIQSARDLDSDRIEEARYVYVSSELLARAWNDPDLYRKVATALIERRQTDGLIFDESDEFRHESTNGSKMLMDLTTRMRNLYRERSVLDIPMIALTATPISSDLQDLDITMAVLYPDKFVLPGRHEEGKSRFSIQALRRPDVAYELLFGEKLIIQWSLEDLFGDKAPKLEYQRVQIPMKPYQEGLYEWVADMKLDPLLKIRLLRNVLLNPELIKKVCQNRGLVPSAIYENGQMETRLRELHNAWFLWMTDKNPAIPDELFSADWIAKYGEHDLLIQCFFDPTLVDDIESLVRGYPDVAREWQFQEAVSPKYLFLKRFLQEHDLTKEKVFIVSPYHKKGITRWLGDPHITDKDIDDNAWSLFEYIRSEWLRDLPDGFAVNIDGSRSFAARDRQATIFREYGDRNNIVVASMESVFESMDWAIRDNENTKNIEKLNVIFLGWPWGWDEFKQMSGRFLRPGQSKPVEILVYEAENSIDEGFFDLVRFKYLLTQMALAGVELDEEDKEFFRSSSAARRILIAQPNVGQAFLQDVVRKLRNRGETEAVSEMSKYKDGKTFFELFAEFYFDEGKDEFRIVGNNAELVKNVLLPGNPRKIISIGAGSCLLARKIASIGYNADVDNVDINGAILRQAKDRYPLIGSTIVEGASQLSAPSERYDAVDCSFMLPWTKLNTDGNQIERVKVLLEANRVLKFGGTMVLTFPDSSFDEEGFKRFTETLTNNFGFTLLSPSGASFAIDTKPHRRIGWILTLQKTEEPNLEGFNSKQLALNTDERVLVSKYKPGKDTSPVVIKIEYPIFDSKRFEVYNPLTGETSTSSSLGGLPKPLSSKEMVDSIKQTLTLEQYRAIWRAASRHIERTLNRNYGQSEEILAALLFRYDLTDTGRWHVGAIQRMVDREINRILREGGE